MRRVKFLCTAICAFSLCGLMLTGCEKENDNTVSETEISETTAASERVSETTQTETETVTEITEAEEIKEYDPVPKSTLNYDKIKDRVIFEDGENTLTAGQFIEALESREEFTHWLDSTHWFDSNDGFQIMDIDKNGIPEIMLYYSNFMSYTGSRLYTVTKEGKAEAIPILNQDIGFFSDEYELEGENPVPYEKDGKTLWISRFNGSGTGGGFSGKYILKYDGSGIDGEVIYESRYETWNGNDENGELEWYRNEYYYIFGEDVTEEEFDKRRDEYMNSLKPSDELHVEASYDEDAFIENLSYALNTYLDMRDSSITY
ncbi:MAG: hypothetical protein K2N71_04575 [Oscillospiraceae bacterium]|nr:hypothetical protein [Oscillospiraceae bacterium]